MLYDEGKIARIRALSAAMERNGKPDDEVLAWVYDAKLFKLFVPRELDGLGAGLPEALRVFDRAAWVDGALGWLVTIGSGGGFFAATLPEREATALFSPREAVLAGSGMPTGTAVPVEGGYRVDGRWRYCSGSTFASFFTANCMIEGAEGAVMRAFAFLPEQVEIVPDWNAMGMRATASHSIVVRDAFVPETMTFDITSAPRYDDPIYRMPFLAFAQTSFAAAALGLGRRWLEECRAFAESRSAEWSAGQPRRLAALTEALAEQERHLARAAERFYMATDAAWDVFVRERERGLPEALWQTVGDVSQQAAEVARSGAQALFPLLGMTALQHDEPLNRIWRDLHTLTQHTVLLPL